MLGLVLAAMPALLVASHEPFSDVTDSYLFHQEIGDLYNARIVTGTSATTYGPNLEVQRGAMAAFIHRSAGRAARAQDQISVTANTFDNTVTSLTIKTGGVGGGTGFLVVNASATVVAAAGTCPCTLAVRPGIGTSEPGLWEFETITDTASPYALGPVRTGSATTQWVFPVGSGSTVTVELRAALYMTTPASGASIQGHLTATYVPLGSTGGTTLAAPDFTGAELGVER
jgi:hypothetical protein